MDCYRPAHLLQFREVDVTKMVKSLKKILKLRETG